MPILSKYPDFFEGLLESLEPDNPGLDQPPPARGDGVLDNDIEDIGGNPVGEAAMGERLDSKTC